MHRVVPRALLTAIAVGCGPIVPVLGGDTSAAGSGGTTSHGSALDTGDAPPDVASADDGGATETVPNLRVAFFGDHGLGAESEATLALVLSEGAALLVVLGDYDYVNDAAAWEEQLDAALPPEFPVLAVAGNHDVPAWDDYEAVLEDRLFAIQDAECAGEIGVQMACRFRGLDLLLSGVGTMDPASAVDHEDFLLQGLAGSDAIWKICAWHKNQHDMQTGGKTDEVGWEAYRICQAGGAIIATGHEHAYGRTRSLTALGDREQGHGAYGSPEQMNVTPGSTFVFVSGLGGQSIRDFESDHEQDTWWASVLTSNRHVVNGTEVEDFTASAGVLFIDFHVDGDPRRARGWYKTIAGEVIDQFDIIAGDP